jgi:GNAT superfamily N-acetyltransferase
MPAQPLIRPGRDRDADGFIALIGACWSQYPGVHLDVDGELPELRALGSYYGDQGGALWVAETEREVVGMIATRPLDTGAWEICRVYVHPARHGGGLGHRLLDLAEAHAIAAGATQLKLWSDTRFDRAHRFYEKRSYVRAGAIRVLDDISNSLEFGYAKPVDGIELLDAAAVASAEPPLSDILAACVAEGAGVPFLPPLAPDTARSFWRGVAREVAAGSRVLFGGWANGGLLGSVTLALSTAENQPHHAEVQKLLVHPTARRRGLGRALMQRLEQEAVRIGRPLLTLDTRSGDHAESLYRSMGWHEVGRVPGFALRPDRTPSDTLFFWKRLDQTIRPGA